ncbi:MAG TPA: hypothetical protein VFN50_12000 [Acidimicrobiales bacterium]|nr:hypothetical protein [Acidimicrobiales bacterium]
MNNEQLREVVRAAVRAPSVHNTQPWQFVSHLATPSEVDAIEVRADRSRSLQVIDPLGRELHMSCGAAIELARLAVRALGVRCDVELLPDPADPDLLALLHPGAPEPPTEEELRLHASAGARYTERGGFDERPVDEALREKMRLATAEQGVWLLYLDRPGDQVTTAVLLARADDIERSNPAYEQELAGWVRRQAEPDEGIPAAAVADQGARVSSYRRREFLPDGPRAEPPEASAGPPEAEHPLVCILGTEGDDPAAWLRTGQALGRLLLVAADEGVSAAPMTQVIEVPATRSMLAAHLGLLGYPQIVLRMGYGHGSPTTGRRPLEDVLRDG